MRLREALASSRTGRAAAVVAVLLTLPSLWGGLALDDQVHWARALGHLPAPRFDLFNFCDGSPAMLAELHRRGILPWFATDGLRLAFFRPLTSLTHVLDYNLWASHPWLMHAENLAIYAALVLVAAALYRHLLQPAWVAGLAAMSYAIEPTHGAIGWIAGRNGYLAPLLGLVALLVHARWRRDGWRPGAFVAPAVFLVGLLAGEAAVGAIAYFLAYAIVLERGPLRPRVASVIPVLVTLGAWQVVYRRLGYGSYGSGLYLDPVSEPARFLFGASERGITLLSAQLGGAPADVLLFLRNPGARVAYVAGALAFTIVVTLVLVPLLRTDRVARFWAAGSLLSIAAVCPAVVSNRLLVLAGVGAIGVMAQLVGAVFADKSGAGASPPGESGGSPPGKPERTLAWFWVVHLATAPPLLALSSLAPCLIQRYADAQAKDVLAPPALDGRTVVIVNTPSLIFAEGSFFLPHDGEGVPISSGGVLSASTAPVVVTRTESTALTLRSSPGLTSEPTAGIVCSQAHPLRPGTTLSLPHLEVQVLETTAAGWVSAATFRFDAPLEDPRFYWVAWEDGRYIPISVPAIGATARYGG